MEQAMQNQQVFLQKQVVLISALHLPHLPLMILQNYSSPLSLSIAQTVVG